MTADACGRSSGGRWLIAWVNLVRLLVILDALKLHSSKENHRDGSCEQKGGARNATDVATVLSGSVMMKGGWRWREVHRSHCGVWNHSYITRSSISTGHTWETQGTAQ